MTENEIIAKLQHNLKLGDSPIGKGFGTIIDKQLLADAIALIRRQQAEIKWLKDEICDIDTVNRNLIKEKAEAIKEFAEKLKENIQIIIDVSGDFELYEVIKDIDNLVKEMVGDFDG